MEKKNKGYIEERQDYVLKELANGKKITVRDLQMEILEIMIKRLSVMKNVMN